MNSKDRFNAQKWEVADYLQEEAVEHKVKNDEISNPPGDTTKATEKNNHLSEETRRDVVIIDRDAIQKNIEKKFVNRNGLNLQRQKDPETKRTVSSNENNKKKNSKKKIIIAILVSCVLLVIIGCIIYALITADEEYSVNEEETTIAATSVSTTKTTTTTEYSEPDYWEGECGDDASFYIQYEPDENGTEILTLNIVGSGAMWSYEDIDWKIDDTSKIEIIHIYNDVSSVPREEFNEFSGVKYVYIDESVKSIGIWAFDGLYALKEIWIYNKDCKINYTYTDDDGSQYFAWTLGSPSNGVEVVCFENSTAEDYVNTFNNGTDTPGYKLSHIVKE